MKLISAALLAVALTFASPAFAVDKRYEIPLADSPTFGPADARVTIVEFIDFQWPHCKAAGPTVKKLLTIYKDEIRLVIKNFPYAYRDYAIIAAEASLAARDQGKYWEMHDLLISRSPKLDRESLIQYARELGLDVVAFTESIDAKKHAQTIERDRELTFKLAIFSTPTFFINGRKFVGDRPLEYFRKIIDEELKNANWSCRQTDRL
jgi:protein-disulfide isomerase